MTIGFRRRPGYEVEAALPYNDAELPRHIAILQSPSAVTAAVEWWLRDRRSLLLSSDSSRYRCPVPSSATPDVDGRRRRAAALALEDRGGCPLASPNSTRPPCSGLHDVPHVVVIVRSRKQVPHSNCQVSAPPTAPDSAQAISYVLDGRRPNRTIRVDRIAIAGV